MGWSSDETRIFVKLYLSHKCLWNIEDEDYKHNHKRQEAYKDISNKFYTLSNIKLSEFNVRTKIKSLRSTYMQYIQKLSRERRSINALNKSSLAWIADIHKCFSSLNIPRNLYNEVTTNEEHQEPDTDLEDSSQNIWAPQDSIKDLNNELNTSNISPTDDDYILLLKNEPEDEKEQNISYKRKCKIERDISYENSDDKQLISKSSYVVGKEDEFDIYGKYIASQLREMGVQRALKIQLRIQNIVSEARLDCIREGN